MGASTLIKDSAQLSGNLRLIERSNRQRKALKNLTRDSTELKTTLNE